MVKKEKLRADGLLDRRSVLRSLSFVVAGLAVPFWAGRADAAVGPMKKFFKARISGADFASVGTPTGLYRVEKLSGDIFSASLDINTLVSTAPNYLHDTYKTMFKIKGGKFFPISEWKKTRRKLDGKFRGEVATRVLFSREEMSASLGKDGRTPFKKIRYRPGDQTPHLLLARMMFGELQPGIYPCVINFEPTGLFRGIVKVKKTRYGIKIMAPIRRGASLKNSKETVTLKHEIDEGEVHLLLDIPGAAQIDLYEKVR